MARTLKQSPGPRSARGQVGSPLSSRRIGTAVALGVMMFAAIAVLLQVLRTDLDWYRTPLSFYLIGPGGAWLQAAYLVLSASLVLLGIGYYGALPAGARSSAPLLLFVVAGLALSVTAFAETPQAGKTPSLEGFVHGVAAQTSLLCTTTAMLIQSWWLRRDAAWRHRFAAAFSLAMLCFVGLWVQALWRDAPRGIGQKLLIAAILLWLLLAALWLRQGFASGSRLPRA